MDEKDRSTPPWLLERRYVYPMIVLIFTILLAGAFFIGYRHHSISTEQAFKEDRSSANLISQLLDEHLKMVISVMESYSNRPLLIQAVKDKNVEKASQHLINLAKNNPDMEIVVLSDRQGTPWASYPANSPTLGVNFAHREWYKGVSREWKSYVSDAVLRVVAEKDLAVQISVPCFDEKGEVIGILVNTLRTVDLSRLFKQLSLDPGRTVTVTDRKGQIVYGSLQNIETGIKPYPFHSGMNQAMAAKSRTFAADAPEPGGRSRYISFARIVNPGWTVFVERERRTIFLSDLPYFLQVTAIAFLLFLLVIVFFVYARKRLTAQHLLEQLRVNHELQISEMRFRELFDNMGSGVAVYEAIGEGEDFILSDLNEAGKGITHFHSDFIGKSVCDVFPGAKQAGLFEIFRQVWRMGEPVYAPASHYHNDRCSFWADNQIYRLPSGEIVAVFDDVTKGKEAEAALQKSEEKYRNLVESISDVIYEIDSQGVLIYISPVVKDMMGYDQADIVGRGFIEFVFEEDRGHLIERFLEVREGIVYPSEYRVISKSGEIRWVRTKTSPIMENGSFKGARGTLIDITKRKQMEEELLRAQKLESVGILAGGIAHDFNNLMGIVQGYMDLALMDLPAEHVSRQRLLTAMRSVEQTKDLTSRLITFSRGGGPHKEIFDICEIIRESVNRTVKGPETRVILDFGENLRPAELDELQMKQCFYILTTNAVEAMPQGGNLTIRAENVRITAGEVLDLKEGAYLKITFTDEGIGIPEEQLSKIFDPYFTTKEMGAQKGSGLGLTICYSILKKHDGHITVKSQPGGGASFILYLPARTPPARPVEVKKAPPTGAVRSLIMDDEPHIREIERAYLEQLGHEVTDVKDGQEATDAYKEALDSGNPFDLVLLDLTVQQGLGGQRTMERLLEIDPSVRAIIVSGYVDDPVIENFADFGFQGALTKPFSGEEMKNLVRQVLHGQ